MKNLLRVVERMLHIVWAAVWIMLQVYLVIMMWAISIATVLAAGEFLYNLISTHFLG